MVLHLVGQEDLVMVRGDHQVVLGDLDQDQEVHQVQDQEVHQTCQDQEVLEYWVVDQEHLEARVGLQALVHLQVKTDLENTIILLWAATEKSRKKKRKKVRQKKKMKLI